MSWYTASTGNHQGLIIDEADGRNVAVAYDKADAPLIAAAPALLFALQELLDYVRDNSAATGYRRRSSFRQAEEAINQAKEEPK
jgi:type VI protein secretion system component VasF